MPWYQKAHRTTGVPPGAPVALALRSLGYHGIIEELPCQDRFYVVLQTCYGWKTVVYWTKESQLLHHAMISKSSQNHGRATWCSCCISTSEFRISWHYWKAVLSRQILCSTTDLLWMEDSCLLNSELNDTHHPEEQHQMSPGLFLKTRKSWQSVHIAIFLSCINTYHLHFNHRLEMSRSYFEWNNIIMMLDWKKKNTFLWC